MQRSVELQGREYIALVAAHRAMVKALEVKGQPANLASCERVAVSLSGLVQGAGDAVRGAPDHEHHQALRELSHFQFDWGRETQRSKIGSA